MQGDEYDTEHKRRVKESRVSVWGEAEILDMMVKSVSLRRWH